MPNGDDFLTHADREALEQPLRALVPTLEAFATERGADVVATAQGMPARSVYGDGEPGRAINVTATLTMSDPKYDISIGASMLVDGRPHWKTRVLAAGVPGADLAARFLEVADAGWSEVGSWTVDDLEPRW